MFIIGGEFYYPIDCTVRNRELENYCKFEGISLMDIKKYTKKNSKISQILRMFLTW